MWMTVNIWKHVIHRICSANFFFSYLLSSPSPSLSLTLLCNFVRNWCAQSAASAVLSQIRGRSLLLTLKHTSVSIVQLLVELQTNLLTHGSWSWNNMVFISHYLSPTHAKHTHTQGLYCCLFSHPFHMALHCLLHVSYTSGSQREPYGPWGGHAIFWRGHRQMSEKWKLLNVLRKFHW
jgi:hypothetical protein